MISKDFYLKHFFLFLVLLTIAGIGYSQHVFKYTNPIRDGIIDGIRDAQILEDNGTYYLIGTSAPFWEGPNPGVKIYSSHDLLHWKFEKLLIDRSKLDTSVWYLDRFWAPEVHKFGNKYYLTFNCRNSTKTFKHSHGCGVAVSDKLLGDYTVLTQKEPLTGGNDLSLFQDTDGKVYAYWNGSKIMNCSEVDMENMKLKEVKTVFRPDSGTWDMIGIEGPYVIKEKGTYYMFYSSWTRGYEIGYATATNPLGPWKKYAKNPIYGGQSENQCKKNNLPYTGDPNSAFNQVGHNEIFKGPDGRYWISCHGILKNNPVPSLVIDPLDIINGEIKATAPTFTEQTIKY